MKRRSFLALPVIAIHSAFALSDELRCRVCGKVLTNLDRYYQVQAGKEVICERCYEEAPRCSVCKLPTAPDDIDPDIGACSKCLAKLPHCLACGKAILGPAYRFSTSTGVFCAACKRDRPACDLCGVPVGDTYWKYPDGRVICNECGRRAVFDVRAVESIMRDVQKTAERRLGLKIREPYRLKVEQLSSLIASDTKPEDRAAREEAALYKGELGLFRRKEGKSEIILLFGLPPDLLYETAAHEYAHAWTAENGLSDLEPELLEGFAQWVAADVLREKGFKGALENLEARTDSPYGTGYQRLKAMQQNYIMDLLQKKR